MGKTWKEIIKVGSYDQKSNADPDLTIQKNPDPESEPCIIQALDGRPNFK